MCGEKYENIHLVIKTNKTDIKFFSDMSNVDKGFSAEFEAFKPHDRTFTTYSKSVFLTKTRLNTMHENKHPNEYPKVIVIMILICLSFNV